ncbi:sigma-70 family RNA polymerase sigma factor [Shewanella intestini]|uniref:Sigma-70 family RNA polymerase sigma factor n=1 Tax=Shewanella intestini TaxID=2017544 RepID=A0ABS5HXS6_9GAMM|nr:MULTISPECIES: sigma-70 family RNA polymerase sigma factor [Shewanella]MBR9726551.1 sigma-70 family RNA polymerase sigma factor [Shewanella intestini]MRG34883.1 sigma-70 family RNA polymerase sigma factor [Shewanella sp. XMDDZSB0408]
MLAYQAGNIMAFEQLYQKHKAPLYRFFVRQLSDQQLAQDLYQDTWSKVIKATAQYQVKAKFTTWLYKIAHNLIIDHVRAVKPLDLAAKSDNETELVNVAAPFQRAPEQLMQQQQQQQDMQRCIAKLPAVQKEALLLNIELGLTAANISEIAGVTLEATKSRIRYAYQNIKACIAIKWQETGS